jgi:hypothetical protein
LQNFRERKVVPVRVSVDGIDLHCSEHIRTGLLEAKRKAASAREEVNANEAARLSQLVRPEQA